MRKKGITLIEIILVLSVVGVLLAIAIPSFQAALGSMQRDSCISNLRQIHLAKEQWGLENNLEVGDTGSTPVAGDLNSYVKDGTASLICPQDTADTFATSYTINALGTNPACKIDATNHVLE